MFSVQAIRHEFLKKGGFVRNVSTMLAGNATAQAITFLAAPIISRLYVPDDFGIMTYISSLVAILSVLASMRYENAIVLPKDTNKANNIFILCVLNTITVSLLLFIIVGFWGKRLVFIVDKSWMWPWLWFVPAGVLLQGLLNSLNIIHTREKRFSVLSISRICTSTIAAITKILPGLLIGSTALWLIGGNIAGLFTSVALLLWALITKSQFNFQHYISAQGIIKVAKEYVKFPQYAMPTGLLNSLSQNLPILLFAYYFSQDVVGYFGLANAVLRNPIRLMGDSISKVYLQKAAYLQSKGLNLRDSMVKTTLGLIGIGIIPFSLLTFGGRWIFSFVFGSDWATAGLYAQLLAPWLFFGFINPPATQVIIVKQALRFNLCFNVINSFLRAASIVIGYYVFVSPQAVIGAFSACGVLVNLFYISYAFSLTGE